MASKGDFGVIMAADSARTADEAPRMKRSSFGEYHGPLDAEGPTRFVQEGKLKIEVIGDCAVTFAGVVSEIDSFIQEFKIWLIDRPALEAFKETATAQPPCKSQIILGYIQKGESKIATFNANGDGEVSEDVEFASFGNLKPDLNRLTRNYLNVFRSQGNDPEQVLVASLSLLQSYGIHDYLISDGVGGGFCGVAINHAGVHWQPDILYLIANEELTTVGMVGSFARDNLWCLYSSMGEAGTVAFGHERPDITEEQQAKRIAEFTAEMQDKHDAGRFEYISVLSLRPHSVTVIEMRNNLYHPLVGVDPRPDRARTMGAIWSTELRSMLGRIEMPEGETADVGHVTVRYFPYRHMPDPPPGFLERLREEGTMFPAPGEEG